MGSSFVSGPAEVISWLLLFHEDTQTINACRRMCWCITDDTSKQLIVFKQLWAPPLTFRMSTLIETILRQHTLPLWRVGHVNFYLCRRWWDCIFVLERWITLADVVAMILRAWALYNRSRFILGVLLTLYAIEVIVYLVDVVILSTQSESAGRWTWLHILHTHYITGYLPFFRSYGSCGSDVRFFVL